MLQVDVGDFLRFKSCVLYTQLDNPEQPLINIEVVAHVTRPELRTSEVSLWMDWCLVVYITWCRIGLSNVGKLNELMSPKHSCGKVAVSAFLNSTSANASAELGKALVLYFCSSLIPYISIAQVSNTFYFTFTVRRDALKNGLRIRNVVPATEEEARRVLERMECDQIYIWNLRYLPHT